MAKAILVSETGGPEVMTLAELDPGEPKPGELVIRQTAMGVNFGDIHKRRGTAPPHAMAAIAFPFTPGLEAAGVVEAVGQDVAGFRAGDRVAYAVPSMLGGYAERRTIGAVHVFKLPDAVADIDAAALLYKGMTVHGLLRSCFRIQPGQTMLLHGAAGGVGTIMARWARHLGAVVIGTVSSPAKAERAARNGCAHVIDVTAENFVERVHDLTHGAGVDVVYDSVGDSTFIASFECLKKYGTMVSFGQSSGILAPVDPILLQHKGHYLTKFSGSTYNADPHEYQLRAQAVLRAIEDGILPRDTHAVYPLADAVTAHRDFENRKTMGSVVLVP